jgi:formate-dependent nitrite reductase cytochrome c552 subunit
LSLGAGLSLATLGALSAAENQGFRAPGSMNRGHERMACESCHEPAPGSLRQQLQANVRYALGLRHSAADFGSMNVENATCSSCHERPFDRHPVSRFKEPRFAKVREKLVVDRCESCHSEHTGKRVTVDNGFCQNCHGDLTMKDDPLDTPHAELVAKGRWLSCLGCHDFHGNHVMKTETRLGNASTAGAIDTYFAGGPTPYPKSLRKPARQEQDDNVEE